MINLSRYIMIYEGGQAGHMAHPIDYTDFTCNDLVQLVDDLFCGRVENMKEKLDGFNIFATMNNDGEVVFIRNKTNLNSPRGGMTIDEMMEKWAEMEHQKTVFKTSGEIITKIFNKLGKKYFNPDPNIRKCINCECIITGKTNIMPYASDRVAFHGYQIYELFDGKWELQDDVEGNVDDIYKAAEGIDAAKPRPNLVIKSAKEANEYGKKFKKQIIDLFKSVDLGGDATIEDYKITKFKEYKPDWLNIDDNFIKIYNRWFNKDKSFKATEIKKLYPEHYEEIKNDKFAAKYIEKVMEPLDILFLSLGNELIDLLDGFTNDGSKDKVISTLKHDMEETVNLVNNSNSEESKEKLNKALNRLVALGNKYNNAEGIVFLYKGRRMKLTGSFAPINQALGTRFKI